MPTFRKLVDTEIQPLERADPVVRARIAKQYDDLMAAFTPGEYGAAEPAPGETSLAVRRRLNAAAQRRGLALRWVPAEGLVFEVQAKA